MQNNEWSITQELPNIGSWFFAFGQTDINTSLWFITFICVQGHLGMPKVIPNNEFTIC